MAKNKMTNRLLAALACVAMLVGLFPVSWISAEPAEHYGSLALLNSDGTVAGEAVTGKEAEVVFTNNALEWFSTENGLRPVDGWWAGARVTAPEGVDTDKATYVKVKDGVPSGEVKSFSEYKHTETDLDHWCLVNEQKLNDALLNGDKYIIYSWKYDWDGNGEYDQQFTLKIEVDGLKLNKGDKVVYPADSGKVTALTEELAVSGKGTENLVTATFDKAVTLEWVPNEGFRPVDGWWAGIRVTAPEGVDVSKVAYQKKGADGWTNQNWSKDAEGEGTYVDFWCLLNEQKLVDDKANYVWRFDWDGDGTYEQLVSLDMDPAKITLMKGDEKCYPQVGTAAMLNANGNVVGESFTGDNAVVSFENLSFEWVAADESIGRTQDGWWAGMRIYAPTYMTDKDDLAKVVFKRKNGEAVTFEESKDDWHKDAKGYYIDQWCLLNETFLNSALINGKKVNYSWLFDWAGDENFEQTVTLSVDPATVTLLKEGEEQKYPQMGAAINLDAEGKTYGDLQKDKQAVVLFTGTFKWVKADESIGRTQDGWWAGMRVYAPAYMQDAADLAKVTFTRKEVTTTYEQSKDDWHYDEDAKRWYIDQWCLITPEFLNNALANQKNVNYSWTFNWGVYDQKVTLSVDPANTVLLRDDKQVYPVGSVSELTDVEVADQGYVANENDESGWYTDATAKNLVLDWVEADESIGRNQRGWWAGIRVTAPKGSDKDTIKYQRKIGDEWADRSWAEGVEDGDHIDFWCLLTHEKLSNKDTTYIWRFDWNGDGKYDQYVTYVIDPATCTLNKKACDDFAFTSPAEKVWTGDDAAAFVADSLISTGTVTYSIVDQPKDGLATIDAATGKITFNQDVAAELKADDKNSIGTITVKATITADEYYEAAEVTHTFEAYKVPFKGFAIKAPEAVTYDKDNNTFENKAYVGDEGTDKTLGTVVYRIKSENALTGDAALADGQHVVTIDENEGNLTILRSGVVTVEAVRVEDGKYLEVIAEYTLTINKGEQTLTFDQGNEISKFYGITEFENVAGDNGDENANADDKITYDLEDNTIGAAIDPATGKITIDNSVTKVGQLKVTATYAEDVCYNACSVSYTLNIAYLPVDDLEVSLSDANDNGWYNGDVIITAPEGYSISYSNDLHGNTWAESVTYTAAEHEGNTNPIVFLRRDADNAISGTYVVKYEDGTVNVDVTKPSAPTITYEGFAESDWKDGYCYKKDAVTVTFAATDNLSQIDYFEYNLGDGDKTVKAEDNQASIQIDPQYKGSISVMAVDKAGNESDLTADERVLVVDNIAPEVEITYTNANLKDVIDSATKVSEDADDNTRFVYNGDVIATIVVDEANFYSEDVQVLLDGTAVDVTWSGNSTTVTISGHGNHTLKVVYADRSGNDMVCTCAEEDKTQTGTYVSNDRYVDTEAPVLNVTFDNNAIKDTKDGYDYYDAHRTATIKVEDPNFYPKKDKVTLTILTKDVDGEFTYANLELATNWTQSEENGNLWITEIPFDVDAVYDFQISVEDVAGNATTSDMYRFVVDTSAPAQPTIKLNKSFLEKVGEWLGYFNDVVTVEISSQDISSDVKEIKYTYSGTVSEFDTTVVTKTETVAAVDGKISFDLPSDFKGTITAVAYNWSGVASAEQSVIYDANDRELHEVVVDNTKPEIFSVVYTEPSRVVSNDELKDTTPETPGSIWYYNKDVDVTVTITEGNFYAEDVVITVNGEVKEATWNGHVGTFTLSAEGDYEIKVNYTDKSENVMDEYASHRIVIDKTNPEIAVTYNDVPMVQEIDGREYYGANRTATITIKEHNFRADDVKIYVLAKDAEDSNVFADVDDKGYVTSYLKHGSNRGSWTAYEADTWRRVDDTYVCEIQFNTDANYEVFVECADLATNVGKSDVMEFTVDKVAPTDLTVDYSETFIQKVTNWLFYNDKATVTLTATDAVARIDYFNISVSTDGLAKATNLDLPVDLVVNADGTVKSGHAGFIGDIQSKIEGGKVTLTFDVPAQFRGKVHIDSVTDRSVNVSDSSNDEEIIVVDTVSPDVKVEFAGSLKDKIDVDKSGKAPTRQTKETADADTRYVYNGKVTATVTVTEANFYEEDVEITVYRDGEVVNDVAISEWTQTEGDCIYTKTIEMSVDGDYQIVIDYKDKSQNLMDVDASGEYADNKKVMEKYTSNIHTIDTTAPRYSVIYNDVPMVQTLGDREYYGADRTATITVTDRNFRPNEVNFTVDAVDINGNPVAFAYSDLKTWKDGSKQIWKRSETDVNTWIATVPFNVDANYTVKFDYVDIAGNWTVNGDNTRPEEGVLYTKEFTVDKVAPTDLTVDYSETFIQKVTNWLFYNDKATVTLSATDAVAGIDYFNISVSTDGLAEATNLDLPVDLVVNADGTVKSGKAGFISNIQSKTEGGKVTLTFDVPAQFRGKVHIDSVTDRSANVSGSSNDEEIIVVDTVSPDVKVQFSGSLKDKIDVDKSGKAPTRQTKETADADTRYVYNGKVTAKITVTEANFYEDMVVTVYCDGKVVEDVEISEWSQVGEIGKYVKTIKMAKDGDYQIKITYKDKSDNVMDVDASGEYAEKVQDKMAVYTSNIHTIDTTAPVYTITYDNNKLVQKVGNREYYGANRTATITVTDRNFRPNEVKFSVVAKDVNGAAVDSFTYSSLTNTNPWEWTRKGNVWTARVPFKENANYTVKFDYTDIAGNKAVDAEGNRPEKDTLYTTRFTVDKVAPIDLAIQYKQPTKLSLILNMITFNWYKSTATVTISATDEVAGIDYFDISINKSGLDEATTLELPEDLQVNKNGTVKSGDKGFIKKFTAKTENGTTSIAMELPVQYSGKVLFTAHDYSGKSTKFSAKKSPVAIVDSIAPQVDVEYVPQSEETQVRYVKGTKDVENFASAGQAYFNGNVTAKITVTEANFFEGVASDKGVIHNVGILLTKTDNNGNVTKIEYLPKGAEQMFADETDQTKTISWNSDGQVHTFDISYEANMDYVLTIRYADLSTNNAVIKDEGGKVRHEYTSRIITVDKTNPTIKVEYGNKDVISTNAGRDYFNKAQTATITIKEHNFRADDVKLNLVAKDVAGNTVEVENFAKYLKTRSNWKHYDEAGNETKNGNVHVATITFSKDANYTLDINYTDLSTRVSKDYTPDLFTVDKTKPATKGLKVTYDKGSIWEDILESITFGFYNAQMTVTVSADDPTAGIYRFEYSYEPSEGVSDINKGAKGVLEGKDIVQIENTSTFTASFKIPKLMLGDDNQFNGTVSFTAYDRAENFNKKDDTKRIVLDNIKPVGTMEFSDPINESADKGIGYYTNQAVGTIVINEANFYEEKVVVTETVNGGASRPVRVEWTHNSTDVHTGVFTLTEEGDHVITVNCEDYSGNKMEEIVSRQITLDRAHPTVTVSNIKNNSANKDEVYGFTITANDINNDSGKFRPVLMALVPNPDAEGTYVPKNIDLGAPRTVENGKTYRYVIENLEEDALYTLTCTTEDMALNSYNRFSLEDGSEYESVTFSINRDGSTFGVDADTAKLLKQYYTHNVENNVVIEEVNVDPVENYVVRLNGTELVEGQDYNTLVSERPNEWYKRTYVIKKTLFENEGEYSIVVESVDKTETTAYSDIKNLKVAFVVDRTAPVLTINGLKDGGTYTAEEQNVTIVPTDDGGRLHSLKVVLVDSEGKSSTLFDMSDNVKEGEKSLNEYLTEKNGEIIVPVPQVLRGQVQIVCNDYAAANDVDSDITIYEYTFKPVTVSPSELVNFYANTPLFVGSIAGVVLLAGGVVLLIVLKKRKKNAAE